MIVFNPKLPKLLIKCSIVFKLYSSDKLSNHSKMVKIESFMNKEILDILANIKENNLK